MLLRSIRLSAPLTASALTAVFASYGAAAQQSAAADAVAPLETIVVTGRQSVIPQREQLKRNETAIVDLITAEQIERLPDRSLAEVLDRVPGVSGDRGFSSSAPRTVTLRGFDARYNSMDVDGNPIWNSSRNNRGTQLDVFPASVVNEVSVYKTVHPYMDANSVGGHISLRTLRAFDGGTQPYYRLRASYSRHEQDDKPYDSDPSFRVDGAGKFTFGAGRQFGLVGGFDYEQEDFYDLANEVTDYTSIGDADVVNGDMFDGLFTHKLERASLLAKLEARATDKLYAFVSASWFNDRRTESFNRAGIFTAAGDVTGATATTGSFSGATAEAYFEDYRLDRETLLIGSGLDYRVGGLSSIQLRASYTNYDHDEILSRSQKFQAADLAGSYELGRTGANLSLDAQSAAALADPDNWFHRTKKAAFADFIPHQDDVYSVGAEYLYNTQDAARGLGFRGGLYWRRLDRTFDETLDTYALPKGEIYTLGSVLDPATQVIDGIDPIFFDSPAYWDFMRTTGAFARDTAPTSDYGLVEDVPAAHAAVTYRGDRSYASIGLRVERTDFTNTTGRIEDGVTLDDVRRFDYTEWLPNLQGSYSLSDNLLLRAAYTETLARPDFSDFARGITVDINSMGYPVVSGSNPRLAPRLSNNYDLSLESYFEEGYASLGVFYKDLDNESFRQMRETLNDQGIVVLTETIPLNAGSASVQGVEAALVLRRMNFLPAPLQGLGIDLNYTCLDGEWNVVFTDGARRTVDGLRNQPRWLGNATLSYKVGRLKTNLGWRLRGRTFTGVFGATADGDLWVDSYDRIDLNVNYKLTPQLTVTAAVRNLNDAAWVEQTGITSAALSSAYLAGRTYWVGVKFKP